MVLDNLTKAGKIGLALFVVGTIFFLVGFSVPYWVAFDTVGGGTLNLGLWEACGDRGSCAKTTSSEFRRFRDWPPSWYMGTQALACLALIALIVDYIVRILFVCGKPKKFLLFSVILDCVTSVLAFLAAVVFGSEIDSSYHGSLSWGFAFDIIGGIFFAGAAACFLVEYIRRR